ncbi:MAG: iron ABC transporter permease [Gammaproteobacteria bacterium]|nr:iron ABC transporter permease [Gammaproteobacteria bacterium]MBT8150717.1 iron ABC transporter permease [Gammaproteobacteria bacterium]NND38369.1 iron ABC transporter permease [Pseudomonadales bacterium]NNM11798.1 iron ABC transporter permease [Pseudomonadales bacterium]RZV54860.1 MAG: iron ABC transporter permease [Pseudomonadales bacterium]
MSRARPLSSTALAAIGSAALLFALLWAISTGAVSLGLGQIKAALFAPGTTASAPLGASEIVTHAGDIKLAEVIVWQLRLPRVLLAACVGALLALGGAIMQGLFRNPLADPSLIGVTAGSIAGASAVIVLGDATGLTFNAGNDTAQHVLATLPLVSLGAFAGGLVAAWLVYRLATDANGTSVSTMLLAGIALTALAGSFGSLLEFFADNTMLRRISIWRMGGLEGASYTGVIIAASCLALMLFALPYYSRALNLMLLGESEARHLGVNVEKLKWALVLLVALATGISVALAGAIAFIGLVVPHIVRLLVGPDHRQLLPLCALVGATLLVLADALARSVIAPAELPVGVLTAMLGAPFFISLLRQRGQYGF